MEKVFIVGSGYSGVMAVANSLEEGSTVCWYLDAPSRRLPIRVGFESSHIYQKATWKNDPASSATENAQSSSENTAEKLLVETDSFWERYRSARLRVDEALENGSLDIRDSMSAQEVLQELELAKKIYITCLYQNVDSILKNKLHLEYQVKKSKSPNSTSLLQVHWGYAPAFTPTQRDDEVHYQVALHRDAGEKEAVLAQGYFEPAQRKMIWSLELDLEEDPHHEITKKIRKLKSAVSKAFFEDTPNADWVASEHFLYEERVFKNIPQLSVSSPYAEKMEFIFEDRSWAELSPLLAVPVSESLAPAHPELPDQHPAEFGAPTAT